MTHNRIFPFIETSTQNGYVPFDDCGSLVLLSVCWGSELYRSIELEGKLKFQRMCDRSWTFSNAYLLCLSQKPTSTLTISTRLSLLGGVIDTVSPSLNTTNGLFSGNGSYFRWQERDFSHCSLCVNRTHCTADCQHDLCAIDWRYHQRLYDQQAYCLDESQ